MIANERQLLAEDWELDTQPNFLVEQEQSQVVEERSRVCCAHVIVPPAGNQDGIIDGQVLHGVPKSRAWRRASSRLKQSEFTMHNFAVNDNWFEVAQLVLELSFLVFASKVVNSVLN